MQKQWKKPRELHSLTTMANGKRNRSRNCPFVYNNPKLRPFVDEVRFDRATVLLHRLSTSGIAAHLPHLE